MAGRSVGDRVQDADGARGRVRYVGPVASSRDAAAVYYGVEWDAWGRGRNDGSVETQSGERVRYFDGPAPRRGQFRCSFVKASKLAAPRVSLLDRILERYGDGDSSAGRVPVDPNDVVVSGEVATALGSQKPIELVGVNKLRTQQTLQTIEKISLAGCQIESLGGAAPGELAALAPNISELDLSSNLLPSWDAVFEIAAELPLLSTLILNGNRLAYFTSDSATRTKYRFENIKVLVLNQTATPWNELLSVLELHFPSLTELHVADNEYSDNDLAGFSAVYKQTRPAWMETVEVLDLSMNRFQSWALVHETLGTAMPKLRQLMVNSNAIQSLIVPSPRPKGFIQLQSLSVTENLIDSWSSIDELNMYPRLDTLRFSKNPLTAQMGVGEVRMIIVARTDRISVFNSSEVPAKERQDCEQLYLKRILHELAVVGDSPAEKAHILSTHPRFETLKGLYPEISASFANGGSSGVSTGPSKLGSSLVSVKIVPFSMQATTFDPLVKKIPEKMKISQLKLLVEKKFGLETTAQMLTLSMGSKSIPIPLDDDSAEIGYYGLQDGAEIFVNDV